MSSIRRFLLLGVLAVLTLFSFIAALRGYQRSMQEADTLFDAQLLNTAKLVANLDIQQLEPDMSFGSDLAFQLWRDQSLLAASYHAPKVDMIARTPGFDYANFAGYRWRTYTSFNERTQLWVMVAERTDLRFVLAENVVLETVLPILLGIPLTGLLIAVVVRRGLLPLGKLSQELQQKPTNDLSPLALQQVPRELQPVTQAVNGLIARLGAALDREKRFSADAAHELRTPIAALKIQLHNVAQELGNKSTAFAELEQGVERMQHLVEQLMALYRHSPEQFAAACSRIDLNVLAQEVLARLYPLFEAKQQAVELVGMAAWVQGERFALDTLLSNLLRNANKFTPVGGQIQVNVVQQEQVVALEVHDNGPGISTTEQARIFERFYRGSAAHEQHESGCGLGLTIVAHVALLHQAQLSVQPSLFGHGTAIRLVFAASQAGG